MIDEIQIKMLCFKSESETLDFKRDQYKFIGCTDEDKSELLKDILSFANAWREENAYILIGVSEENGHREIVGINPVDVIDDATIQQFINNKTNKVVPFISYTVNCQKGLVQVIEIRDCGSERPFFSVKDYGKVKKNVVKVKRGSSTDDADLEEIVRMGEHRSLRKQPILEAAICPAGTEDFRTDNVTIRVLNIDFDESALNMRREDPPRYASIMDTEVSPIDKMDWIKQAFRVCSLNLRLKNVSDIQARDLRIEATLNNTSFGFKALDYFPQKPERGPFLSSDVLHGIRSVHDKPPCIHPQDSHVEYKIIYFIPEGPGTADLNIKVFGENIKNPPEYKFKLNVFIENRTLTEDHLTEDLWEELEEEIIFKALNGSDEGLLE